MLSASMLREEVDVILDLVAASKIEEAKQRLDLLRTQLASDYGKGVGLALSGIISMITKTRGSEMFDSDRVSRAAERIAKTQTLDDLDRGYFQTLSKWSKRVKQPQPGSHSAPQA